MNRVLSYLALIVVVGFGLVPNVYAEDSAAMDAAQAAVAEPAAQTAETAAPVVTAPAATPTPTIEPTILKQLREHTPIPIRSSLDQAIDSNGNRTLEYDEIKEYIKSVRASIAKGGHYPTNTDILYHFDKNHDGYMDSGEVAALESYIH